MSDQDKPADTALPDAPDAPDAPEEGSVTVAQALELAVQLHTTALSKGVPEAMRHAETIFVRILEAAPGHPDALHHLGVLMHQTGRGEQGMSRIREAIAAQPDNADFHNNLGNVLKERGHAEEAITEFRTAIALDPQHAGALNNLGVVLKSLTRYSEAVEVYQRALALDSTRGDVHRNLGNVLDLLGRGDEAVEHFHQAIKFDVRPGGAYQGLAHALFFNGRTREAIEVVKQWVEVEPENPHAIHTLAAFSGEKVPSRAPDAYVRRAFDAYAASFDNHIRSLGYRAPEVVQHAVVTTLGPAPTDGPARLAVLDIGCGTGLCAPFLRPYARRLVGVDLSPRMLARAREAGLYDDLVEAELTAFLASSLAAWDLAVCVDTLCYFGDLGPAIRAAADALCPAGRLVFTVEHDTTLPDAGYRLTASGRYAHTEAYVRRVVGDAGLTMAAPGYETLRFERNEPVAGLVVTAHKPGSPGGL